MYHNVCIVSYLSANNAFTIAVKLTNYVTGTLNPAGYIKAMQRMKTLVTNINYIIPGHDAGVFAKFPLVANGIAEIK